MTIKNILFFLLISGIGWIFPAKIAAAKTVLLQNHHNLEKVTQGSLVKRSFPVMNDGAVPLQIKRVEMTDPIQVKPIKDIAPGQIAAVQYEIDTAKLAGAFSGNIVITFDDPKIPAVSFGIEGDIVTPIEVAPMPAFFVAAARGESKQQALEIINHEKTPLEIINGAQKTERFSTKLETLEKGQRYRLTLTINPQGPLGKHQEILKFKTTSKIKPILNIGANTYLHERVYTFPESIDMGSFRLSDIQKKPKLVDSLAQTLMVISQLDTKFNLKKVSSNLHFLNIHSERSKKGDRYQLTLTLKAAELKQGAFQGEITIETEDKEIQKLTVPIHGTII